MIGLHWDGLSKHRGQSMSYSIIPNPSWAAICSLGR